MTISRKKKQKKTKKNKQKYGKRRSIYKMRGGVKYGYTEFIELTAEEINNLKKGDEVYFFSEQNIDDSMINKEIPFIINEGLKIEKPSSTKKNKNLPYNFIIKINPIGKTDIITVSMKDKTSTEVKDIFFTGEARYPFSENYKFYNIQHEDPPPSTDTEEVIDKKDDYKPDDYKPGPEDTHYESEEVKEYDTIAMEPRPKDDESRQSIGSNPSTDEEDDSRRSMDETSDTTSEINENESFKSLSSTDETENSSSSSPRPLLSSLSSFRPKLSSFPSLRSFRSPKNTPPPPPPCEGQITFCCGEKENDIILDEYKSSYCDHKKSNEIREQLKNSPVLNTITKKPPVGDEGEGKGEKYFSKTSPRELIYNNKSVQDIVPPIRVRNYSLSPLSSTSQQKSSKNKKPLGDPMDSVTALGNKGGKKNKIRNYYASTKGRRLHNVLKTSTRKRKIKRKETKRRKKRTRRRTKKRRV